MALAQAPANDVPSQERLPLELDWKAPAGCASETAIRSELARIAHVRPGRTVARLTAHGRIEKHGELYKLTLRTERSGEKGERTLSAPECRALEREVTLVLALAFGEGVEIIEPETAPAPAPAGTESTPPATPPDEPPAPPAEKPREQTPPPAPPVETTAPRAARSGSRFPVAGVVGGGAIARVLPALTPAFLAGADIGSSRFWLSPRFIALVGTEQSLPRGVVADYSGGGASLAACAGFPGGPFLFGGCAGASVLQLYGTSRGATESAESRPLWWAATGSALAQWPSRGLFAVRLEALLAVSLSTPRFVVEGLGEAHTAPRLAPGLTASVVFGPLH